MTRSRILVSLVFAWLLILIGALGAEARSVGRIVFLTAKPGAKVQLEQAIRTHMDWRKQQQDEWRWIVWEYVTGNTPGRYAIATFGHEWGDFDNPKVAPWVEEADNGALAALCEKPPVVQYVDHLEGVSRAGTETEIPALAEVVVYQLHFGKTAQFSGTLPQFAAIMDKLKPSVRFEWFEVLEGGETPAFLMMAPRANWAGLESLKESIMGPMIQLVGKQKALAALDRLSSAVRSQHRDLVRLRQDLSYLSTTLLPQRSQ